MARLPRTPAAAELSRIEVADGLANTDELPSELEALLNFFEVTNGPQALAYFLRLRIMELNMLVGLNGDYDREKSKLAEIYQHRLTLVCNELS